MATTYSDRLRLDGRGYLVLGAGPGIGGQVCRAISEAGGRVLCADRDLAAAQAAAAATGGQALAIDVTSPADIDAAVAEASRLFGSAFAGLVDVVGLPVVGALQDQEDSAAGLQFDLVLNHAVRAVRAASRELIRNGGGSIVLIGSLAGLRATRGLSLYGAAKAALHSYAQTAALELGEGGVRVNVVSPGRISASGAVKPSADSIRRIEAAVPLGRLGEPADIAGPVLFLLSDLAAYVSGIVLPVDGGIGPVSALPN